MGLKTVLSLNCSDKIQKKYEEATNEARKAGIVRSIKVGFATGSMLTTMNLMYLAITLFGGWALSVQVRWYTSDQRIIEDSTPPNLYYSLSSSLNPKCVLLGPDFCFLLVFCWWVWLDVNTCMA